MPPNGLRRPEIRSTRIGVTESLRTVERANPNGEYEAIVGHIGAMADSEDRRIGWFNNADQYAVCALRGFGLHRAVLGTGTYGAELEHRLRLQARSVKSRVRHGELKFIITNRIARAASTGGFGSAVGEGMEILLLPWLAVPMGAREYRSCTWGGAEIEDKRSGPNKTGFSATSANNKSACSSVRFGPEHKKGVGLSALRGSGDSMRQELTHPQ